LARKGRCALAMMVDTALQASTAQDTGRVIWEGWGSGQDGRPAWQSTGGGYSMCGMASQNACQAREGRCNGMLQARRHSLLLNMPK
jgi:hypothetical protein